MSWFRRGRKVEESAEQLEERLRALVAPHRIRCVGLKPADGRPGAISSYVGGHPYWPEGSEWPMLDGSPMVFVCQMNFADVPPLPGFPTSGLLQWFVGSDDTFGLTFDDTGGLVGFHTRWIADPGAPSTRETTDPTPAHEAKDAGQDIYFPLDTDHPIAVEFVAAEALPSFDEVGIAADDPTLRRWAESVGEDPEDVDFVWNEYVRGASGPFADLWNGSNIGGSPTFTQEDVRGAGNYAAASDPAGRVLIELDSDDFSGWGDAGVAHLFGDPTELATGTLSSGRYQWDCL